MTTAYRKALHTALVILTRRDHSAAELGRKLVRRGVEKNVIDAVLAECSRLNYLNDDRFAAGLISRLKRKGWGPLRMCKEFQRHGLRGQESERLLSEAFDADEELQIACAVAKKKLALNRTLEPRKRKERVYRFLSSRGFSNAVIHEALRIVFKTA